MPALTGLSIANSALNLVTRLRGAPTAPATDPGPYPGGYQYPSPAPGGGSGGGTTGNPFSSGDSGGGGGSGGDSGAPGDAAPGIMNMLNKNFGLIAVGVGGAAVLYALRHQRKRK